MRKKQLQNKFAQIFYRPSRGSKVKRVEIAEVKGMEEDLDKRILKLRRKIKRIMR